MICAGRLSRTPPSTYKLPLNWMGLKTAGTQLEANMVGTNSPDEKYSDFPLLISVAATIIGFFSDSKLFSGICFNSMSRSPSRLRSPVHVQAGRSDLKKLDVKMISRILSGSN